MIFKDGISIKNGVLIKVSASALDEKGRFEVPYNVKSIAPLAFFGLSELKEVSIGKNVKSIEEAAFEECDNLKTVNIYGDLDKIGQNAFFFCDSLENFNIEGSVKKIGNSAFANCSSLRSILLPSGLRQIGNFCFSNCVSLDKILLPKTLNYIGRNAFADCNMLNFLELPDNITFLGESAFANCVSLYKVKLPEKLEKISSDTFCNCRRLDEVEFGNRLTFIDVRAFYRCNVKKLHFPSTLIKIGKTAFGETFALKDVTFEEGIKEIDEEAFRFSNINNINFPQSLEYIGFQAFGNNDCLKQVNLPKSIQTIEDYAFSRCAHLQSVTVPSGEFGSLAFYADDNLKELNIGENCKIRDMDLLVNSFTFLNKTENGFSFSNTPSEDCVSLKNISNINPGIIIAFWDKKDKILKDIQNEKIAILYNTVFPRMTKEQFNDFLDNKNMKFFNQLCTLNLNNPAFEGLVKIFYNLGGFTKPVQETRKSKSGNIINENVNYAQIAGEFLKEKISTGKLSETTLTHAFRGMNADGFKRDFARFFVKNFDELIAYSQIKNNENFIARCYNDFEGVQRFNTSNKGSQRQLAPTISKFIEYFDFTSFIGINDENAPIADAISPFFKTQSSFQLALDIYNEKKKNNTGEHILKVPLAEKPFKNIDNLSKDIKMEATDTLHDMVDTSEAFTYEWLSKNDPQNLILGKLCNCCAHIEGAGYGIMRASIVHPNVQNLVIRNKDGEIVAKATLYVNRKNGYGIFNTFKIRPSYRDDIDIIYKKLIKGAKAFIREYNIENPNNPLTKVTVGRDFNDFEDIMDEKLKPVEQILTPINYGRFGIDWKKYEGDSYKEQYLLWEKDKNI